MIYVLFALLNGVLIVIARSLNGRLAAQRDALFASWVNHLVGFIALSLMLLVTGVPQGLTSIPPWLLLGGVIGALYVSLNSYIVPKLGVTIATLLVIAGQLVLSIVIDIWLGKLPAVLNLPMLMLVAGSGLLVFGFYRLMKQ